MRFAALVAVLAMAAACATGPATDDRPRVEQVQPASLGAPHGLEFKVVDDGSNYMKEMLMHVGVARDGTSTDPDAIAEGVSADIDRWRTQNNTAIADFYLTAKARSDLTKYLADAAAKDPKLAVPRDRELAFEQVAPDRWRTYLVFPAAELDTSSIAHASVALDPNTDRPIVLLDFTPAASQHFGELTTRISGHKLAVLVDGTVTSAPIINGPIMGGRASITFGRSDAVAQDAEAHALADSLNAHAAR
jgi:hypothetical protein